MNIESNEQSSSALHLSAGCGRKTHTGVVFVFQVVAWHEMPTYHEKRYSVVMLDYLHKRSRYRKGEGVYDQEVELDVQKEMLLKGMHSASYLL